MSDWEVPPHTAKIFVPRGHEHLLVIPVLNEGDRIRRQLSELASAGFDIDVVIVDGGSTDGALDDSFLRTCGVRACLTNDGPRGLGSQLRIAYAWALEQGYRGVVTMDGNGKDGPDAIPAFVQKLREGYDYVQGSRYRREGRAVNTPLDRHLAGRLIHAPWISLASGVWYTDTTNGFRAYSADYLRDESVAPFRDVFRNYSLLFYLSTRAGQLGLKTVEIPVTRSYPQTGPTPTKIGGIQARLAMLLELLRAVLGLYAPSSARTPLLPLAAGAGGTSWVVNLGAAALCLGAIALLTYSRFRGVHSLFLPFVQHAFDPSLYPFDFYIQHAIVGHSSILLSLVSRVPFDLTSPIFVVAVHLLCVGAAGWAVALTLRDVFGVRQPAAILLILTILLFADDKFAPAEPLSWICRHNVSFTSIAIAMRFWAVYFLLRGRFSAMALVCAAMLAVTVKIGWFVWCAGALAMIMTRERKPWPWGLLLAGLIYPLWSLVALAGHDVASRADTLALFELVKSSYPLEDNPFAASLATWLSLIVAVGIFVWWANGAPDRRLGLRARALLYTAIAVFFVGGLYITFLYPLFPLPMAVLLSPRHAIEAFAQLAFMAAVVMVVGSITLDAVVIACLVASLCVFKVTGEGHAALYYVPSAALAACAFGWHALSVKFSAVRSWSLHHLKWPALQGVLAGLCVLLSLVIAVKAAREQVPLVVDSTLGFIPSDIDAGLREVVRERTASAHPVVILASQSNGARAMTEWNYYLRTSGLSGNPYYLPTYRDALEQLHRNAVVDALADGVGNDRALSDGIRSAMAGYSASVVAPATAAHAFAGWSNCNQRGGWIAWAPRDDLCR